MTDSRSRKPSRRSRVWLAIIIVALIAGALGFAYWRTRGAASTQLVAQQATMPIRLMPHQVTVAGPGSLEPGRSLTITSKAAGTMTEMAGTGDRVTQGQIIARLDPTPFERAVRDAEMSLEKAEAQLTSLEANQADSSGNTAQNITEAERRVTNAEREAQRAQSELALRSELGRLGSESAATVRASQDAYDVASADLTSARAALERLKSSSSLQSVSSAQERRNAELAVAQARLALDDARLDLEAIVIGAPFAGVVAERSAQVGGHVAADGALLTLINDGTMLLPVQIDETQISAIQVGQAATVALDAIPGRVFSGRVTEIAPIAQVISNIPVFYVTVSVDNPDSVLRAGMTAEADIITEEHPATATVPLTALQMAHRSPPGATDERILLVQGADGSPEPRTVTIVDSSGFNVIVIGDLTDGELVVLPPAGSVPAGRGAQGGQPGAFPRGAVTPAAPMGF